MDVPVCPYCQSIAQVRSGHTRAGNQRYLYRGCLRRWCEGVESKPVSKRARRKRGMDDDELARRILLALHREARERITWQGRKEDDTNDAIANHGGITSIRDFGSR